MNWITTSDNIKNMKWEYSLTPYNELMTKQDNGNYSVSNERTYLWSELDQNKLTGSSEYISHTIEFDYSAGQGLDESAVIKIYNLPPQLYQAIQRNQRGFIGPIQYNGKLTDKVLSTLEVSLTYRNKTGKFDVNFVNSPTNGTLDRITTIQGSTILSKNYSKDQLKDEIELANADMAKLKTKKMALIEVCEKIGYTFDESLSMLWYEQNDPLFGSLKGCVREVIDEIIGPNFQTATNGKKIYIQKKTNKSEAEQQKTSITEKYITQAEIDNNIKVFVDHIQHSKACEINEYDKIILDLPQYIDADIIGLTILLDPSIHVLSYVRFTSSTQQCAQFTGGINNTAEFYVQKVMHKGRFSNVSKCYGETYVELVPINSLKFS